ncbi:outer-membrane lipoprotein carrier protein LolA [Mariprofundus sp. EBB-1]|uniref:LolA family protein n=1 Tax=Mariprofundus sp. EBB-1 TaxID=2650971 RepID=UPI001F207EEF|nr:outer-membrane lipoprotein carrier protein LolA [Mariprofundus sp. EBB-1]
MKNLFFLFALCCMFVSPSFAAKVTQQWDLDADAKQVTIPESKFFNHSIKRLSSLPGFQCHFDQLIAFTDGGGKKYSGSVAVLKPKRFRWQYQLPYEQLYLGDGDMIWHYEPDLMQAERLDNIEAVDASVMGLLDGSIAATEIKMFKQEYDSNLNIQRFQVRLKDSPKVWLGFSNDGNLVYIERQDVLGNSNQMRLSECSYIAPPENLFSFTPPEGVDVLDMRQSK